MHRRLLAALLALAAAPAQAQSLDGVWAAAPEDCAREALKLQGRRFENSLGGEARSGRFDLQRDTLILHYEDGEEQVLPILDASTTRLVVFDETIEGDRRLRRCR